MSRIRFRKKAEDDLRSIITYYDGVAPHSLNNILSDIHRSIDLLLNFPQIGMPVPARAFRRIVTLRYHFKIAYQVDGDMILILGIFRFQDRDS